MVVQPYSLAGRGGFPEASFLKKGGTGSFDTIRSMSVGNPEGISKTATGFRHRYQFKEGERTWRLIEIIYTRHTQEESEDDPMPNGNGENQKGERDAQDCMMRRVPPETETVHKPQVRGTFNRWPRAPIGARASTTTYIHPIGAPGRALPRSRRVARRTERLGPARRREHPVALPRWLTIAGLLWPRAQRTAARPG